MYIPGLECAFTDNKEGVALIRMNSPETNITAIEMNRNICYERNQLVFTMHMKADTTDDERTALFDTFNAPLQGVLGKIYDEIHDGVLPSKYIYTPVAENEYWGRLFAAQSNEYWGRLFAAQSRVFTPFESRPTHLVMLAVDVDTDADVCDVIEAVFSLLGIFRDADTKPARMC